MLLVFYSSLSIIRVFLCNSTFQLDITIGKNNVLSMSLNEKIKIQSRSKHVVPGNQQHQSVLSVHNSWERRWWVGLSIILGWMLNHFLQLNHCISFIRVPKSSVCVCELCMSHWNILMDHKISPAKKKKRVKYKQIMTWYILLTSWS